MPKGRKAAIDVGARRHMLGLTQEDLAQAAGLAVRSVRRAEAGGAVAPATEAALLRALGVDLGTPHPISDARRVSLSPALDVARCEGGWAVLAWAPNDSGWGAKPPPLCLGPDRYMHHIRNGRPERRHLFLTQDEAILAGVRYMEECRRWTATNLHVVGHSTQKIGNRLVDSVILASDYPDGTIWDADV